MQERLTYTDVERLLSEPMEEARARIALKVAGQFRNVVLTPRERELAQEILGYLVHDIAAHVRGALSRYLSVVPEAPHDVILALAEDIDEVALPILENSTVLTEEDMVRLVLSGSAAKQRAIAGRATVPAAVSDAIVWADDRRAVLVLVSNDGAIIRPEVLHEIVDRHGDDEEIVDPMARRKDLPAILVERLVTMVSDQLRLYLIERHGIDPVTAALLEEQAREHALVEKLPAIHPDETCRVVAQLAERKRLSASLLLRAICAGELRFVEQGFAQLTSVSDDRVTRLIHDVGALGFRAVYARAGLPEVFYPAFRTALDVVHELEADGYLSDKPFLRHCMLKRIGERYPEIEANDIDFLLDRLIRFTRAITWRTGHAA